MLGVDFGSVLSALFMFTLVHLDYQFLFVEHSKANWLHYNNGIYQRRLIQKALGFKQQVP